MKGISLNRNAANILPNNAIKVGLGAGLGGGGGGGLAALKSGLAPANTNNLNNLKAQLSQQEPLINLKGADNVIRKQPIGDENYMANIREPSPPKFKSGNNSIKKAGTRCSKIPRPLRQLTEVKEVLEKQTEEIEDIDKPTSRDALFLACDIAKDIYQYMNELEEQQSIKQDFLKDQAILTPRVRQRLINWCIEIHSQLKLLPETLYIAISVIDRYFERVTVKQQSQVQLVAVGAILIASKYEEIYPPDVSDLVHLTQKAYNKRDIMRIEIDILERLKFELGKPIPLAFLRRFSKAAHSDLKMHSISKYLMELSLTEYECTHWKPSLLAAAALFTTIHLVNSGPVGDQWNGTLVHYTTYSKTQLQEPAGILCKILKRAQKSPQSYTCVKKNIQNLTKWPELKSARVDDLIKLCDQM